MTRRGAGLDRFDRARRAFVALPAAQASKASETFDAAWTIIRDSHFDPGMNGVDWPAVKAELAPARRARSERRRAARRHSRDARPPRAFPFRADPVWPRLGRAAPVDLSGDPGFEVRLVGQELLVTQVEPNGGAAAAGVKPGWRLLSLDAMPVADLLGRLPSTMPDRLRQVEVWRMIENRAARAAGSQASLMFDDGHHDIGIAIERRAESGQPATVGNLPTMYVRVDQEERRTPRGAQGRGHSFQRLDAGRRSAVPAGHRPIPQPPAASSSTCAAIPAAWRR